MSLPITAGHRITPGVSRSTPRHNALWSAI